MPSGTEAAGTEPAGSGLRWAPAGGGPNVHRGATTRCKVIRYITLTVPARARVEHDESAGHAALAAEEQHQEPPGPAQEEDLEQDVSAGHAALAAEEQHQEPPGVAEEEELRGRLGRSEIGSEHLNPKTMGRGEEGRGGGARRNTVACR
jgi:hypothetical protein